VKQKTMVWTYVVLEAAVLIPLIAWIACHK